MVWALLIPAVAAVASAAMQWMNSSEAGKATQAERDRIKGMLDKIQDPSFDVSMIQPEDLQVIGKNIPQAIPLIQQAAPQVIKAQGQGQTVGRDAQMQTLQNYLGMARTGRDPITEMQQAQAARQAQGEATSARNSAQLEASRRGFQYNPAMAIAGAGQNAMQNLALSGQQAAADAYGRRNQAAGQAASLGGQMFGQDTDIEKMNADIANTFNRNIAENAQNIAGQNVSNLNAANASNLANSQRVSDANTLARNQARVNAQQNRNTYSQQGFNNQLNKAGVYAGQTAANQQSITDLAKQQNQGLQSMSDLVLKGYDYYNNPYGQRPQAQQTNQPRNPLVRG